MISLLHEYLLETDELKGVKQEKQFMEFLESIGARIDQPNQHPIILNGGNMQSRSNVILSTAKLLEE